MRHTIPPNLKIWFTIHFLVDTVLAIPLIIFPGWILHLFGFTVIIPTLARLVGAALLGIGVTSLFTKTKEQFEIMLTLKIVWSLTAIMGLLWSIAEGAPGALWAVVIIFILFLGIWMYYKWER